MKKNVGIALLLCCSQIARAQTFEERIWKEFQDDMDQMRKRFDIIEKYMNESFPLLAEEKTTTDKVKITSKKLFDITTDNNYVILKLHLGELNTKEIDINAEDNSLDGKVPLKDGSANFSIQNGRLFELSIKHEQKKEEKSEKDKTTLQSFESAAATKIESLPDIVTDLEKTQVSYKNGILELKLPRIASQKKGTKLDVKADAQIDTKA